MFAKTILLSVIFVLLSACTAPTESPAPVATLTATISPTETSTPAPTSTPTPEPTATPEIPDYIRDIKIVDNPLKWRTAPEVDAKDMPALAYVLMEKFNNNEFNNSIPANFRYIPFNYNISGYKYHGITAALNPLVGNPRDLYGLDNRWYFLSSMYKDKESGRTIAHYFIMQKDGSVSQYFANLGINIERVVKGNINDLIGYISGNDKSFTVPADFSEADGCLELISNDTEYCNFYMSSRDSILELYKEWAKTGFVPLDISNGKVIIPLQGKRAQKP